MLTENNRSHKILALQFIDQQFQHFWIFNKVVYIFLGIIRTKTQNQSIRIFLLVKIALHTNFRTLAQKLSILGILGFSMSQCTLGVLTTLNFIGACSSKVYWYLQILNPKFQKNRAHTKKVRALPSLAGEPPNLADRLCLADGFRFQLCATLFYNLLRKEKCQFVSLVMCNFSVFRY